MGSSRLTHPRLSKLMSERGICSRREADHFIEQGLVRVDGETAALGTRVAPTQTITLAESARRKQSQRATVLLNKPAGYVSGSPEKGYRAAVTLLTDDNHHHRNHNHNHAERAPSRRGLAPAGRLDIDSTGLIVFTDDGRIARQLIGPQSRVEKEYLVWAEGGIDARKLALLRHGLSLDGKPLRPARIDHLDERLLRFTLIEGRKRQIRRMCEQLDLRVFRLLRVRIGAVTLGNLASGKWRRLRSGESF